MSEKLEDLRSGDSTGGTGVAVIELTPHELDTLRAALALGGQTMIQIPKYADALWSLKAKLDAADNCPNCHGEGITPTIRSAQ